MKVNSPYERSTVDELAPGKLVLLFGGNNPALAITVVFQDGDKCCLILEGDAAGTLTWDFPAAILAFKGAVVVELPAKSAAWLGKNLPQGLPLTVAVCSDKTYFVFINSGKYVAAEIETGLLVGLPSQALYLTGWEIWPDGEKGSDAILVNSHP